MTQALAAAVALGRAQAARYRPDRYAVVRATSTPDDAGGGTATEAVVEEGGCLLTAGATRPQERAIADRLGSQAPLVVRNLPWDSGVTAQDTLLINGTRRLNVVGVLRAGALTVALTAVCEEVE